MSLPSTPPSRTKVQETDLEGPAEPSRCGRKIRVLRAPHNVFRSISSVFGGICSEFGVYLWRAPAACLVDTHSVFRNVFSGSGSIFRGSPRRVSGDLAACFLGYPQQSPGAGSQWDILDFRYWFSGFPAAVFRLVAASDLWEKNSVLAEGSRIRQEVSVIGFEIVRKKKCRREKDRRFVESTQNESSVGYR